MIAMEFEPYREDPFAYKNLWGKELIILVSFAGISDTSGALFDNLNLNK